MHWKYDFKDKEIGLRAVKVQLSILPNIEGIAVELFGETYEVQIRPTEKRFIWVRAMEGTAKAYDGYYLVPINPESLDWGFHILRPELIEMYFTPTESRKDGEVEDEA